MIEILYEEIKKTASNFFETVYILNELFKQIQLQTAESNV